MDRHNAKTHPVSPSAIERAILASLCGEETFQQYELMEEQRELEKVFEEQSR